MALSGLALFMITRFYPDRDHFTRPPSEQSPHRLLATAKRLPQDRTQLDGPALHGRMIDIRHLWILATALQRCMEKSVDRDLKSA
jgi:hypothetical protein